MITSKSAATPQMPKPGNTAPVISSGFAGKNGTRLRRAELRPIPNQVITKVLNAKVTNTAGIVRAGLYPS
jgi:hypothetical protein|tara:strand:+ start:429 stop:638 length:210 start_codon:yes stop_codon:yes gene_type:complete